VALFEFAIGSISIHSEAAMNSQSIDHNGLNCMRIAMVTNIPAPYRMPVYEILANTPGIDLLTIFFAGSEPDRNWQLSNEKFRQVFLKERFVTFGKRFIHINPDIWGHLQSFNPDVVITTGFNPSHLLAYAYARISGAQHVAMTDGTFESEIKLSGIHRWVRRKIFNKSQSFIGASNGSFALYESYGIAAHRIFKSYLCANNIGFQSVIKPAKKFDFIFCGRFVPIKNPLFSIELVQKASHRLGRPLSILFVGSGEMESQMKVAAAALGVNATFAGFAQQTDLPMLYGAARIFVFPTQWDPWGVVANEACAAGLPVLISPHAGSAGELVRHGENGFVLALQMDEWVDAACKLISDNNLYASMAAKSLQLVQVYSFENSALGIVNAIKAATAQQPVILKIKRQRIVIVQRRMTHYRVALFELLKMKLDAVGIDLDVVFGNANSTEMKKDDSGNLEWGIYVPCRYFFNGAICLQNFRSVTRDADLVVLTQENKLIVNHVVLILARKFKVAFWGHGANLQSNSTCGFRELFKRWTTNKVDWWFGYTKITTDLVKSTGFPEKRITQLNNTVDTMVMQRQRLEICQNQIDHDKALLGFENGLIGIYVGSLYADKRLGFLFQAAELIQQRVPEFKLLIVGDGPEQNEVKHWCSEHPWSKWVGAKFGKDKVALIALADVMLNPGLVGLGILDSFVCGVPMLTTNCGVHSPEIAYLENGVNGIMTEDNLKAYVDACASLLGNATLASKLRSGCLASAEDLTIDNMASRFAEGLSRCLASPSYVLGLKN